MERNHVPRSYKSTGKRGSSSFLLPRPREVWDLPAVTVWVGPRPLLPLRGCPSGPTGGAPNCRNQASTLRADPTACLARAGGWWPCCPQVPDGDDVQRGRPGGGSCRRTAAGPRGGIRSGDGAQPRRSRAGSISWGEKSFPRREGALALGVAWPWGARGQCGWTEVSGAAAATAGRGGSLGPIGGTACGPDLQPRTLGAGNSGGC